MYLHQGEAMFLSLKQSFGAYLYVVKSQFFVYIYKVNFALAGDF